MNEIITKILETPATSYIVSFGSLGTLLMLALNNLHKRFKLAERSWGFITLGCGAIGGMLLHLVGLVALPGNTLVTLVMAAFIGAATAAAAAGFSAVDLRATITKSKGDC